MIELNCFRPMSYERKSLSELGINDMGAALCRALDYDCAVLYCDSGVYIAKKENGCFVTHIGGLPTGITEIRAFDENGELHAVLCGNELRGRIITDGTGSKGEIFDERHLLFGERCELADNGFFRYTEDRGTTMYLPFSKEEGERSFMEVRNYAAMEGDDFRFIDWRFIRLGKEAVR